MFVYCFLDYILAVWVLRTNYHEQSVFANILDVTIRVFCFETTKQMFISVYPTKITYESYWKASELFVIISY